SAGLAPLECVHLRRVGALLVFVVERGPDAVADEATNAGTNQGARDMAANTTAKLRTDSGAPQRTQECSGVLLRARAHSVRTSGAPRQNNAGDCDGSNLVCGHLDPQGRLSTAEQQGRAIGKAGLGQNSGGAVHKKDPHFDHAAGSTSSARSPPSGAAPSVNPPPYSPA